MNTDHWHPQGKEQMPVDPLAAIEGRPTATFEVEIYQTASDLRAMVGHEPAGPGGELLWHLSIVHPKRYPTWDEIHDARYQLLPVGKTFALILPPKDVYVNVHPNCFHLWEIEDPREGPKLVMPGDNGGLPNP